MKPPKRMWIPPTLSQVQELVGGEIEEYMPFEDEVAILCNEEGKSLGLPFNRAIYREPKKIERCYLLDGKREIEDIIAGPFLICYAPLDSDKYDSLPERLLDKYQRQFQHPEIFFTDLNGKIEVKEVEEKEQSWER